MARLFDGGDDPESWIQSMEDYFEDFHISMDEYVKVCISCLRGEAANWAKENALIISKNWCAFCYNLIWRFSEIDVVSPKKDETLAGLKVEEIAISEKIIEVPFPSADMLVEFEDGQQADTAELPEEAASSTFTTVPNVFVAIELPISVALKSFSSWGNSEINFMEYIKCLMECSKGCIAYSTVHDACVPNAKPSIYDEAFIDIKLGSFHFPWEPGSLASKGQTEVMGKHIQDVEWGSKQTQKKNERASHGDVDIVLTDVGVMMSEVHQHISLFSLMCSENHQAKIFWRFQPRISSDLPECWCFDPGILTILQLGRCSGVIICIVLILSSSVFLVQRCDQFSAYEAVAFWLWTAYKEDRRGLICNQVIALWFRVTEHSDREAILGISLKNVGVIIAEVDTVPKYQLEHNACCKRSHISSLILDSTAPHVLTGYSSYTEKVLFYTIIQNSVFVVAVMVSKQKFRPIQNSSVVSHSQCTHICYCLYANTRVQSGLVLQEKRILISHLYVCKCQVEGSILLFLMPSKLMMLTVLYSMAWLNSASDCFFMITRARVDIVGTDCLQLSTGWGVHAGEKQQELSTKVTFVSAQICIFMTINTHKFLCSRRLLSDLPHCFLLADANVFNIFKDHSKCDTVLPLNYSKLGYTGLNLHMVDSSRGILGELVWQFVIIIKDHCPEIIEHKEVSNNFNVSFSKNLHNITKFQFRAEVSTHGWTSSSQYLHSCLMPMKNGVAGSFGVFIVISRLIQGVLIVIEFITIFTSIIVMLYRHGGALNVSLEVWHCGELKCNESVVVTTTRCASKFLSGLDSKPLRVCDITLLVYATGGDISDVSALTIEDNIWDSRASASATNRGEKFTPESDTKDAYVFDDQLELPPIYNHLSDKLYPGPIILSIAATFQHKFTNFLWLHHKYHPEINIMPTVRSSCGMVRLVLCLQVVFKWFSTSISFQESIQLIFLAYDTKRITTLRLSLWLQTPLDVDILIIPSDFATMMVHLSVFEDFLSIYSKFWLVVTAINLKEYGVTVNATPQRSQVLFLIGSKLVLGMLESCKVYVKQVSKFFLYIHAAIPV